MRILMLQAASGPDCPAYRRGQVLTVSDEPGDNHVRPRFGIAFVEGKAALRVPTDPDELAAFRQLWRHVEGVPSGPW